MREFLLRLLGSHKKCDACIAKDYMISILREQLKNKDSEIERMYSDLRADQSQTKELLAHFTGLNRTIISADKSAMEINLKSVPRRSSSIFEKIRMAEEKSARPELVEQRHREYNDRVNDLLKEVEVLDKPGEGNDAV